LSDIILRDRAVRLGDSISTDDIIPGRFAHLRSNLPQLAEHVFEDALPGFTSRVKQAGILVAGRNFGLGSSREHAPLVIKMAGVKAVVAESVARIFYRNAINQGLPVLLCDTGEISDGDELEIDLARGVVSDLTSGAKLDCSPMAPVMLAIVQEGGLIPYIRKHKGFLVPGESDQEHGHGV